MEMLDNVILGKSVVVMKHSKLALFAFNPLTHGGYNNPVGFNKRFDTPSLKGVKMIFDFLQNIFKYFLKRT